MKKDKIEFEVERKRKLNSSVDTIKKILIDNGFSLSSENHEIDTYYSRPDIDYMETVECLRIRERDGFAEFTYKPASSKSTTNKEGLIAKTETNIEIKSPKEAATAKKFLDNIGMVRLVEVNKKREIYKSKKYKNLVISIDEINGLGFFVEVEVTSSDKIAAEKTIESIEEVLEISKLPIVKEPYRDLCMKAGE